MLLTLSEITKLCEANPAPLLLLDTCTFLDIIRVPYRENIQVNIIKAAMALISRSQSKVPDHIWLYLALS